jgi:hypothetical protein
MHTLFEAADRQSVLERISRLEPGASRQWGKMNAAQMLAHCAAALEVGTGDSPRRQAFIGKLLGWLVRSKLLGEKPFPKNSPTDPTFVVTDPRDFGDEKRRLVGDIAKFCDAGPDHAGRQTHSFLGSLRGDEWGVMMYKHLDHHLRQFGA